MKGKTDRYVLLDVRPYGAIGIFSEKFCFHTKETDRQKAVHAAIKAAHAKRLEVGHYGASFLKDASFILGRPDFVVDADDE